MWLARAQEHSEEDRGAGGGGPEADPMFQLAQDRQRFEKKN
jgi:hypothetical protein